jgi:photosynthetic reaction center cytochrome c subunit
MMKGKTRLLVAGTLMALAIYAFMIRAAKAQSGAASAKNAPKTAEQQFKNIQVLKGVPADQIFPAMQFITASLGVECEFCHVEGAFEKDDKKTKQTARQMMQMMFTINKENFDSKREVTCYSCHRGSVDPVNTPLVTTEEAKVTMHEARSETEEVKPGLTVGELFDKYVQAVGGAAAIDKVTSRVQKGTIDMGQKDVPIEIYSKNPEERISFMHTPDGDSITALNGHEGWLGFPGHPVREMHEPDLDAAAIDADLHLPNHLKGMFSEAEVRGIEKIDEREAYLVIGKREGKPPLRLYFDQQSGLLVRLVRYGETPLGRLPTQIDYADYRDVDGLKIPFRWTLARSSGRFTIQVNEVKENVPVDDSKFVKPTQPKGEAKQ